MVAERHETLSTSTLVPNRFILTMRTTMKSTLMFYLISLLVYAHTNPKNGMYYAHWTIEFSKKKKLQFGPYRSPSKDSDT